MPDCLDLPDTVFSLPSKGQSGGSRTVGILQTLYSHSLVRDSEEDPGLSGSSGHLYSLTSKGQSGGSLTVRILRTLILTQ